MSFTSPNLQEIAKELAGCSGTVWHVATGGNDSTGDGLAWGTAFLTVPHAAGVASAGDLIVVGAGTFSTALAITTPCPIKGAGKYLTELVCTGQGTTFPRATLFALGPTADNVAISDLTIQTTQGQLVVPLGWVSATHDGFALRNIRAIGQDDCLVVTDTGSPKSLSLENCDLLATALISLGGTIDTVNINVAAVFRRCRHVSNASGQTGTDARGVFTNSPLTMIDCVVQASGGAANNLGVVSGTGAALTLTNCALSTAGAGAVDAVQTAGTLAVVDCSGSGAAGAIITSGTVTTMGKSVVASVASATLGSTQSFNNTGQTSPIPTTSAGQGAYTYTITAQDTGGNNLQNISVSLTSGITQLQTTTNSSGVAIFNVNAATWTVAAFSPGYSYAGSFVPVSANGNTTIVLTLVVPPANPGPGQIAGWLYTQLPGTVIAYQMTAAPAGMGNEFTGALQYGTSDSSGYWVGTFYQGASYTVQSGDSGTPVSFTAPTSGTQFSILNLLGA